MNEQPAAARWPSVSILILNWNGRGLLEQYVPPLTQLDYPGTYKLVLVDNGSTDDSLDFVTSRYPQIQIIANGENLGFSKGINRGLQQAADEVTVLLNTDVEVRPDWLTELVRPFLDNSQIGITGSKLYYPDGNTLQHAGVTIEYPRAVAPHRFYREKDSGQADALCEVDSVTGAAMAIHQKVLAAIGLLDEQFSPFYYEESDFCVRAREAGFLVVYQPASVAIHHESFSFGEQRQRVFCNLQRNRLLFVMKHKGSAYFRQSFVPAEIEFLQALDQAHHADWLHTVYRTILLYLPEVGYDLTDWHIYEEALVTLMKTAAGQRSRLLGNVEMNDYWLMDKAEVKERPFTSQTPVVGGIIAWFRTLWNNVATKWYVRPLLTQQNEYNQLTARALADHDGRLLAQDHDQTDLTRQLAELTMQIKQMNQRLADFDQRLTTLEETTNSKR